jgi:hypothetical protein
MYAWFSYGQLICPKTKGQVGFCSTVFKLIYQNVLTLLHLDGYHASSGQKQILLMLLAALPSFEIVLCGN